MIDRTTILRLASRPDGFRVSRYGERDRKTRRKCFDLKDRGRLCIAKKVPGYDPSRHLVFVLAANNPDEDTRIEN